MTEEENSLNLSKKEAQKHYIKENYKEIKIRIRKDDYILKLLEIYRKFDKDKSINSLVCDALFEYLNFQISKLEKQKKQGAKNDR